MNVSMAEEFDTHNFLIASNDDKKTQQFKDVQNAVANEAFLHNQVREELKQEKLDKQKNYEIAK